MTQRIPDRHRRRLVGGCFRRFVVGIAWPLLFVVALVGVRRPFPEPSITDREVIESRRKDRITGREEVVLPHLLL